MQFSSSPQDCLINLAGALVTRFLARGIPEDLEEGIKTFRILLRMARPDWPYRAHNLSNLGKLLILRYQQSFDTDDIQDAIVRLREALALSPLPDPFWAPILFNLMSALNERYLHTPHLGDLMEAVELSKAWIEHHTSLGLMNGEHLYLDMVAECRRLRFERLGDVADLDEALHWHEEAARTRPEGYSTEHNSITSFATTLRIKSELTHSTEHTQRALVRQESAAHLIQLGHRDRAGILFGLAHIYLTGALPTKNAQRAPVLFCEAVQDGHSSATIRLVEGLRMLRVFEDTIKHGSWDLEDSLKLLEAHCLTVRLLPQIAIFGLDLRSRFNLLSKAPTLARDAAIYAMQLNHPETALELLEEGRAVFWTQYLRLQSVFDELPSEMRRELEEISRKLESGASNSQLPPKFDEKATALYEEQQIERRRLSERFDQVVVQARHIPGFDRFLLHDVAQRLSKAAIRAPVVVLLASSRFCGALVVRNPTSNVEQLSFHLDINSLAKLVHVVQVTTRVARALSIKPSPKRAAKSTNNAESAFEQLWDTVVRTSIRSLGGKVS